MLIIGWLAACFVLFAALMAIYFSKNFFDWQPNWDWRTSIFGICVLASITATWFLARATRDWFSLIVSSILCLALAGFAFYILPAEQIDKVKDTDLVGNIFPRHSASPLWFRGGIAAFMALPAVF